MMFQSSCSELLVDTTIHDPVEALRRLTNLFRTNGLDSSPPLTVEILEKLKIWHSLGWDEQEDERAEKITIVVFDKDGNRASLEYGNNGYIDTGYRFDSDCSHGDQRCFPIFKKAIDALGGQLISCDGGSTVVYENWDSINREEEPPF